MRQHDGHEPRRIREGDEAALAGNVAGEIADDAEKGRVMERCGEGEPLGLVYMLRKNAGMPQLRPASSQFLP